MKHFYMLLAVATATLTPAFCAQPFAGRWDLTITTPKGTYPSWMEFAVEGGKPVVRLVGRVASVHAANDVTLDAAHLTFASKEYFGDEIAVTWDLTVADRKITGTQKRADGVEGTLTGAPAPAMKRAAPVGWSEPEPLFNGKNLTGWLPDEPAANHWKAVDGELLNEKAGANLRTKRKFQDFKLHIEYNCPKNGNSGVYLRGRYEVQVEYEAADANDKFHGMGSIYGFLAPAAVVPQKPGEWETYDVTLVGRRVTVVRDGITTIDDKEIPGITGGALDSNEGMPGPLFLQGDHTGGMKYRNITISVPKP